MRSKGLWASIVIGVIVALGGFAWLGHRSKTADDSKVAPRQTDQATVGEQGQSAVSIQTGAFSPTTLTTKVGTTVTWTNQSDVPYNVTSDSDSPNGGLSSPMLDKSQQFSFTFNAIGTYKYHSTNYPSVMQGTVIVTE